MTVEHPLLDRMTPEEIIEVSDWDEEMARVPAGSAEGLSERANRLFVREAQRARAKADELPIGPDKARNLAMATAYQRSAEDIAMLLETLNLAIDEVNLTTLFE